MTSALINHLWQSTLFAVVAAMLTIGLRQNPARVRYWLWLSASFKFLVPFSLLVGLGSQVEWTPEASGPSAQIAAQSLATAMVQVTQPFPEIAQQQHIDTGRTWVPDALLAAWVCGFVAIILGAIARVASHPVGCEIQPCTRPRGSH